MNIVKFLRWFKRKLFPYFKRYREKGTCIIVLFLIVDLKKHNFKQSFGKQVEKKNETIT